MFNCVLTYLVTQTAKQLQCKFQCVLFVVFEAMTLTVCSRKSPAKLMWQLMLCVCSPDLQGLVLRSV